MKALIVFIVMAVVILTLIEINERIKSRKPKAESQKTEDCEKKQACSECGLVELCEKKPTDAP